MQGLYHEILNEVVCRVNDLEATVMMHDNGKISIGQDDQGSNPYGNPNTDQLKPPTQEQLDE